MAIENMFLDSGAFSLGPLVKSGKLKGDLLYKKSGNEYTSFWESKGMFSYMDSYAEFVKANKHCIDVYVNVDVLDNPELTYRNQKYLEQKHGLNPVPVIHSFTPLSWINKYIEEGHDYIALGGMGGKNMHKKKQYVAWLDKVFSGLCPRSNDWKPIVKLHGFAVTSWWQLVRYPWYSVDSTTYAKMAGYGWLLVPRVPAGADKGFDWERPYFQIGVCSKATKSVEEREKNKQRGSSKLGAKHYDYISPAADATAIKHIGPPWKRNPLELRMVEQWLDHIGIPLGEEDGSIPGVVNSSEYRIKANLHYFYELQRHLNESRPWPWQYKKGRGGLFNDFLLRGGGKRKGKT